jgi:hypothetical protein
MEIVSCEIGGPRSDLVEDSGRIVFEGWGIRFLTYPHMVHGVC